MPLRLHLRVAVASAVVLVAGGAVGLGTSSAARSRVAAVSVTAGKAKCAKAAHAGGDWPMYGHDLSNTRTQPKEKLIGRTTAPLLAPAWTFAAHDAGGNGDFTGTPVVAGGCLYMASNRGWVFAANADDGKTVWATKLPTGTANNSVAVSGGRVYVAVSHVGAPYLAALDARTGKLLWRAVLDGQPGSDAYGSPMVYDGVVVIGVSGGSAELGDEADRYAFQGSFSLVDAKTGKVLRKTWTIRPPDRNREKPKNDYAGAGVWSTAAIDPAARVAYMGTANPFKPQAQHKNADAVVKVDLNRRSKKFGQIVASYSGVPDEYVAAGAAAPCAADIPGNPAPYYPQGVGGCGDLDLDFGAAPNLFKAPNGRRMVGAGQKSGIYHVFDAATMKGVKQTIVGYPSAVGGIVGSTAHDGSTAYGPITAPGYVWAADAMAGRPRWVSAVGDGAHWGNPVTVANGVVYTTDLKGFLDAYDAQTGAPLLHRPMAAGSGRNDPTLSWGGVAVARNTVYAAVGMTGLDNGMVVGFRPGGGAGGAPKPPPLPGIPGGGQGNRIVAGPQAQFYGYLTPAAVVAEGGKLEYTNADIVSHDVVQDVVGDHVAGSAKKPWCKNYAPGKCPVFWTPLKGLGETTAVQGLDQVKPGQRYSFYCTLHPGMRGTLVVTP
jgi:polyvinyl alcohol dehydrogenase (cytochrome)